MNSEANRIKQLISRYKGQKRALVQILLDLQDEFRWLSSDLMKAVADGLNVPLVHVYGVATFYKSFSLEPRGRHICTVCMGTACHVRGGPTILEHFERKLGIEAGETSQNGEFTLEKVNCLGACALAPLVVLDGTYHGQMSETKANTILGNIVRDEEILERRPADKGKKRTSRRAESRGRSTKGERPR